MATLVTGRSEWPVVFSNECPPAQFVECYEETLGRFRQPLVALIVAVLLLVGVVTAVAEADSVLRGDSLSFQERADVMTALDVGRNVFASGDPSLIDYYVADDAPVTFPGGSASGPEAALRLSRAISGGLEHRSFLLDYGRIEGDKVILDWELSGPIAPGDVIWYSVPEGSSIAGELEFVVDGGQVEAMTMTVNS